MNHTGVLLQVANAWISKACYRQPTPIIFLQTYSEAIWCYLFILGVYRYFFPPVAVLEIHQWIIPSLFVSFSPNVVSFARSSDAWMKPLFCLSVIWNASKISASGSSCCICLCIMVRKVEKSSSPAFSEHKYRIETYFDAMNGMFSFAKICGSGTDFVDL